jgi:hypothetical protein
MRATLLGQPVKRCPGEFEEAITAMRDGAAYANVHTVVYPTGEIRGQINPEQF